MKYQTLVLSGGGSKGAYGLGVLLALDKYHRFLDKGITKIYCGTSVGALNATLAAQGDLDKLSTLYSNTRNINILGSDSSKVKRCKLFFALKRRPFYYFDNSALRSTITKYVDYEKLKDSHLLICATNYETGVLETFYLSTLIDGFVAHDQTLFHDDQRFLNFHRINSQESLIQALLASTAIPFYLPPVEINDTLYVDGGVGNNTPLRQAAYICRSLSKDINNEIWPTCCVINDPQRFSINPAEVSDIFGVVGRTMDIFHNQLIEDSHMTWDRINNELKNTKVGMNVLGSHIDGMQSLSNSEKDTLKEQVVQALGNTSLPLPRKELVLQIIRPSTHLVNDILHFDPREAEQLKLRGIADYLTYLSHEKLITTKQFAHWIEEIK